jgi:hypothetical protein
MTHSFRQIRALARRWPPVGPARRTQRSPSARFRARLSSFSSRGAGLGRDGRDELLPEGVPSRSIRYCAGLLPCPPAATTIRLLPALMSDPGPPDTRSTVTRRTHVPAGWLTGPKVRNRCRRPRPGSAGPDPVSSRAPGRGVGHVRHLAAADRARPGPDPGLLFRSGRARLRQDHRRGEPAAVLSQAAVAAVYLGDMGAVS